MKDFDSFLDHKMLLSEDVDPLFGRALFSLTGQKWKGSLFNLNGITILIDICFLSDMRATLSPAFTGDASDKSLSLVN